MLTLTDFLLARVAEDDAMARKCAEVYPPPWDVSDRGYTATVRADEPNFWVVAELQQHPSVDGWLGEYLEHIARHDPARVLAECEATRGIMELHCPRFVAGGTEVVCFACRRKDNSGRWALAPCSTLRMLALPYADHPDFREEWRP